MFTSAENQKISIVKLPMINYYGYFGKSEIYVWDVWGMWVSVGECG
jgi:hypothetical protein